MAELMPLAPMARFSLRGAPDVLAAGCAAFGTAVPDILRVAGGGERHALWLGPDEVLLLGPDGAETPVIDAVPHALVAIGARQVGLALSGEGAEAVLAAGCPLDCARIDVGGCTRTVFGKAPVVLWRTGRLAWHIEVWRSFAAYAQALLLQAGRDWAA